MEKTSLVWVCDLGLIIIDHYLIYFKMLLKTGRSFYFPNSFFKDFFFSDVYVWICKYVHMIAYAFGGQKRWSNPLSYRWLGATHWGY